MSDKKQKIKRPDEMPDYQNQRPHSTHSLNHGSKITAANGHLMPVFYDYLNAGETVDIGIPFELITEPLVSCPQQRISVHTEYFFVPMELIFQPFGDWYYNIRNQYSSMFDDVERKLPLLDLSSCSGYAKVNRANWEPFSPECIGLRHVRLFDLLDLPTNFLFGYDEEVDPIAGYFTFPYGLAAYHCIYQYFYRLDNREKFKSYLFNFDKFYDTGLIVLSDSQLADFVTIKYRPLDNDYFTDLKVSPLVDVLNMNVQTELAAADSWLTRKTNVLGVSMVSSGSIGDSNTSGFLSGSDPSSFIQTKFGNVTQQASLSYGTSADLNTANIRAMFASEKLWSITGRAKKRYDDQTLAHFGFKVPHDPKHEISRFGHDVTPLDIGMVLATGASSDTPLGEIAGKGRANGSDNHHRFTAPCHGVVMAIMSIVPEVYYVDYRSKYTVVRDRSDLYTPEYDSLGMQPLFGYELGFGIDNNHDVEIFGWQYRYEQWKRRFNKCSSAYRLGNSRASWAVTRYPRWRDIGDFPNTESYGDFLHFPDDTNSIFVPQYLNGWSEAYDQYRDSGIIYDHDPFNLFLHIQCSKRSLMSDYSLPKLDA